MLDQQLLGAEQDRAFDRRRLNLFGDRNGLTRRWQGRRRQSDTEALRRRIEHSADRPPVQDERYGRTERATVPFRSGKHLERMALADHRRLTFGLSRRTRQRTGRDDDSGEVGALRDETLRCGIDPAAHSTVGRLVVRKLDYARIPPVQA